MRLVVGTSQQPFGQLVFSKPQPMLVSPIARNGSKLPCSCNCKVAQEELASPSPSYKLVRDGLIHFLTSLKDVGWKSLLTLNFVHCSSTWDSCAGEGWHVLGKRCALDKHSFVCAYIQCAMLF